MDQESFEHRVKNKFESAKRPVPTPIWERINAQLNNQALDEYRKSQLRYRWVAVAAVFIAFLSFAVNINLRSNQESTSYTSFNALLSPSSSSFRFYIPEPTVTTAEAGRAWSRIVFLERVERKEARQSTEAQEIDALYYSSNENLVAISPSIEPVAVEEGEVSQYMVPQYRSLSKNRSSSNSTFWAGLEAGAGSFDPTFSGSDPIATSADFDAIASTIGQGGFVNPNTTATQSGMEEGVVTAFGLDVGLRVGERWTLESGVQYASVQNNATAALNISDIYTINPLDGGDELIQVPGGDGGVNARETQIEQNVSHDISLENTLRFTSIPLKAGYFLVDKKMTLRVNAGITANYFLSSRLADPTGQLQSTSADGVYNEWSFDGLTGFEFGYQLDDNFNLTIEPNYVQSITPLSQSLTNRSGFMVQTGLRYTLK